MNNKLKEILDNKIDNEYNKYVNDYKERNKIPIYYKIKYVSGFLFVMPIIVISLKIQFSNYTPDISLGELIMILLSFLFGMGMMISTMSALLKIVNSQEVFLDKDEYYKNKIPSSVENSKKDFYKKGSNYYKNKVSYFGANNKEYILNKNECIEKSLSCYKNKPLSLNEINLLREDILNIKNKMSENEFDELIFRAEKLSGEKIGNAYFYLVLFENHKKILQEIKNDIATKNIVTLKSTSLLLNKNKNTKEFVKKEILNVK